ARFRISTLIHSPHSAAGRGGSSCVRFFVRRGSVVALAASATARKTASDALTERCCIDLDTVVFAFVSGLFAAKWKRGSDDVNPVIGLNIVAEFERTAIADQELVVEYLRDAVCAAGLQRELYVVPDD